MFDVFGSVKGLIKLDSVNVDNNIFRLHYKGTVIVLVAFSLLVTSRQYIGDPIDCIVEKIPPNVMDTYCWIHSTFTIPNLVNARIGEEVAHAGVGPGKYHYEEKRYHMYYQWVCFFLFLQAIMFYIPRYMWKTWEGGKIKMCIMELNCPIVEEEAKNDRKKLLVDYFSQNLHSHNLYAIKFFFCEILNFINVIGQLFFMDTFLGGEFTTYGIDVVRMTESANRTDPMSLVFPKVTKCTFHKFGASGTVERVDGLCVLPLNIVNEKIMVFLWFWFIIVAVVSALGLFYRLAVCFGPPVRLYLLRAIARLADRDHIEIINQKCQIGDWFVLSLVAKNMDPLIFREFVRDLARRFEGKDII